MSRLTTLMSLRDSNSCTGYREKGLENGLWRRIDDICTVSTCTKCPLYEPTQQEEVLDE